GLAGSAAISLLVLTTLSSTATAVLYLVIFGIGTIIGMTLLTAVMAYPVSMALRYGRARRAIALCAGIGSRALRLFHGYRLIPEGHGESSGDPGRERQHGTDRSPSRSLLGRPDGALAASLRNRPRPDADRGRSRLRPLEEGGGAGQPGAGPSRHASRRP